jgi:enoyl-CoA hydratase
MSEVIFEEIKLGSKRIGCVTLNREQALNALSKNMCEQIFAALCEWEQQKDIDAIVIKALGKKAFCAGGDIRSLYAAGIDNWQLSQRFFWQEYRLNYKIKMLKKPCIVLLHGICMGGGVGLSLHGELRIAKPDLVWAMPESGIGLFPDVGVSYFFSRINRAMAHFVLLTGARLDAFSAQYLGVVDYVVDADFETLFAEIATKNNLQFINAAKIACNDFLLSKESNGLLKHRALIERCFQADSIYTIMKNLENADDAWAEQQLQILQSKAPLSLQIIIEQLKRAEHMRFAEVMQMDYRLASHFLQCPDLYEGIRAVVIDKDRKPQWSMSHESISRKTIESFFAPLVAEDLALPD